MDNAVTCANIRVGKNYLMGPKNEVTVGYLSDPLLGLTMEPTASLKSSSVNNKMRDGNEVHTMVV